MSEQEQITWQRMLTFLEGRLDRPSFNTWIRPLVPLQLADDGLRFAVPTDTHQSWLSEYYGGLLARAYRTARQGRRAAWVEFTIAEHELYGQVRDLPVQKETQMKDLCDRNCNECPIVLHPNMRLLTRILNEAYTQFGEDFYTVVERHCPNMTCCFDCRFDDFTHLEGCAIVADLQQEEEEDENA